MDFDTFYTKKTVLNVSSLDELYKKLDALRPGEDIVLYEDDDRLAKISHDEGDNYHFEYIRREQRAIITYLGSYGGVIYNPYFSNALCWIGLKTQTGK